MFDQEQEDQSGVIKEGPFEAYKKDEGNFLIIANCRMTRTVNENLGHAVQIKEKFKLNASASIIALYLKGFVTKVQSDPPGFTASGRCVFFVDSPDIDKNKTQLKVNKEATFYFKNDQSEIYQSCLFSEITNLITNPNKLIRTSSTRTQHRDAKLFLFPE